MLGLARRGHQRANDGIPRGGPLSFLQPPRQSETAPASAPSKERFWRMDYSSQNKNQIWPPLKGPLGLWVGLALPSSSPKVKVLVTQSCLTFCNPVDCSPPGSSVHGILQARIREWVAMPFCRGSSPPRDRTRVAHTAGRFLPVWATREACSPTLSPVPTVSATLWISFVKACPRSEQTGSLSPL